ncbi:hypothetical protein OF83DRAFT_1085322, partial [Amylostereum chailletii]
DNVLTLDADPSPSWPLPHDFFLVYVCPLDPRERPKINHSLLDKFAMSATINLSSPTRHAYAAYLSSTSTSLPPPPPPSSPFIPALLARLRALSTPAHAILHPTLRTYLSALLSAARLHHELDGALITTRAFRDAEALARAHRILGLGGDPGTALVHRAAASWDRPPAAPATAVPPRLDEATRSESVLAPTSPDPPLDTDDEIEIEAEADINDRRQVRVQLPSWDDRTTTASVPSATKHAFSLAPSSLRDPDPDDDLPLPPPAHAQEEGPSWVWDDRALEHWTWDLSEGDVARIAPRVLSHRVRVRDGPRDEVLSSAVYVAARTGAAKDLFLPEVGWKRRTVKDIVIRILKDV